MVFYGVLDLCAKPVFALVHLFSMRGVDYSALQLSSGKYSEFNGLGENGLSNNTHHHSGKAGNAKMVEKNVEGNNTTTAPAAEVHGHNGNESTLGGH